MRLSINQVKRLAIVALAAPLVAVIVMTSGPSQSFSASASDVAAVYKAKCASCHGADGSGNTPAGKKSGARDFKSAEVKGQSDAALLNVMLKGKNKMPGYEKSLGADQCKALVAYCRSLMK
jgi:mono/diheme cytochrome c family protein